MNEATAGPSRVTQTGASDAGVMSVPGGNALADCLDAAFNELPAVIRRAHQGHIYLSGSVQVTRGRGLARLIAGLIGLPATNDHCHMIVEGTHLPDRMVWARSFDGKRFESTFRRAGDCLIEQIGPIAFRLRPVVESGRLVYQLQSATIGGFSLPRRLMPRLVAWESEHASQYDFVVELHLPLIGRVIRYAGQLDLKPA